MINGHTDVPQLYGFRASVADPAILGGLDWQTTTEDYCQHQQLGNVRVTREYVEPICRRTGSRKILDVGCGVGESVETLVEDGFDAYGVDLACLASYWDRLGRSPERFFVVEPDRHLLPFDDGSIDLAMSFGVIEHVGTVDGHATRFADYHERRAAWLREIFRVVRPGGHLLIAGPNKAFPVDFSHDLDAAASRLERLGSQIAGFTIHKTWGDNFLWSYSDIERYLEGLPIRLEALSIHGLLQYGRVPRLFQALARSYVKYLPRPLLATGFNPWVMALVKRLA